MGGARRRQAWTARAAAHAARVRRLRRSRTSRGGRRGSSIRCTTSCSPTTPTGRPSCGAGTRATASRSAARRGGVRRLKGYAERAEDGHRGVRPRTSSASAPTWSPASARCWCATARRDRRSSAASGCTSGRWSTASARTRPGTTPGRCGSGSAGTDAVVESPPDRLLALRRVPVLHPRRAAAQHPPARPRRPAGLRAAGLPARRDGPLQARVPAHPDGRLGPGRRLLRARPWRSASSTCARRRTTCADLGFEPVRIETPEGKPGVRRRAARVRRARRAAASAARRGVRPAPRGGGCPRCAGRTTVTRCPSRSRS